MARKPRFILPGVPQHIVQRGHNREPCFYAPDDCWRFRGDLQDAANANQVAIHAYVLMTNHVHLLATPAREHSIAHMMQDLGRRYVRYINYTYRRTGSLWEGRFKASLVDSEAYLLTCMRYIEMNPVRANMVQHPAEYAWSSHAANAQGQIVTLITPHPLYLQLGADQEARLHAYRELFNQHLDKTEVHAIREALNQELVLGREDFKDKIEAMLQRQVRPGTPGRPRLKEVSAIYYVF